MNRQLKSISLSLVLLFLSSYVLAAEYTVRHKISLIQDDYIIIDDGNNDRIRLSNGIVYKRIHGFETEYWIKDRQVDYKTMEGIGYTHEADIIISNDVVRKIQTLSDDM